MKDISQVTCCVVDTGLFVPFARRMAESCERVIYWSPDMRGFPSLRQSVIGYGFDNIQRALDFWPMIDEIDLFCFPDVQLSGLQTYLESIGKAVWGSRRSDRLELDREHFLQVLANTDLDVPPYETVDGLDRLVDHLRDKEDQYIKVSRWRGDFETFHWRSWELDCGWLDEQAVNWGPFKNCIPFLVFPKIDTNLEIGGDTYNVDGAWPNLMLNGVEGKDKSYFASVTPYDHMPEQIRAVLEAFGPELGRHRYRNQWSMEVRVKDDKAYFIDATCRGGMPSSGSQQLLWDNFPEIVWTGAQGQLVHPKVSDLFSIECMVTAKGDKECWNRVALPQALDRNIRFSYCGYQDGCYVFPYDEIHHGELGWLVATGKTPKETLDHAKELADQLPDGLNADVEALASVISEIDEARGEGISFTHQTMPEPSSVL